MDIAAKMQVIEIRSGQLTHAERAISQPAEGQVLIKVMAAGINRPDIMQRQGKYAPPLGASDIPGLEIAGVVVAVGDHANKIAIGDKVCALVTGGGYAEYCLASSALCLPIPDPFSFEEAAGIPETYFTVWSTVFSQGKLKSGESVLVHGGSSGIGTTAIQLAKALDARIIVTVGNAAKSGFCLDLGADAVINYREQDFVTEIATLTETKGVNVILDMIGGSYFPRNLQCLAIEGRLVQIAVQESARTDFNLLPILTKRLIITGSTLRPREERFKAEIAQQLLENVWPLFQAKRIKPIIHACFALKDADKAHELMETSQHMGKIILTVNT